MKKDEDWEDRNEMAENEMSLLKKINHEHCISYFAHFEDLIYGTRLFCVVCELCEVQ